MRSLLIIGALAMGTASSGCGASTQDAETAARCTGVRLMFDEAQAKMIESGACDHVDRVESCVAHIAMREAFILALTQAECGTAE